MNNSVRPSHNRSPRTRALSRVFTDSNHLVMVGPPTSLSLMRGTQAYMTRQDMACTQMLRRRIRSRDKVDPLPTRVGT